jgi:hypothetical protein
MHIKRPMNSFLLYSNDKRKEIQAYMRVNSGQIQSMIAEAWRQESPHVKAKYAQQALEIRKEHLRQTAHLPKVKRTYRKKNPVPVPESSLKSKMTLPLVNPLLPMSYFDCQQCVELPFFPLCFPMNQNSMPAEHILFQLECMDPLEVPSLTH